MVSQLVPESEHSVSNDEAMALVDYQELNAKSIMKKNLECG